jgi:SagB-type dehydrogenase family enzyme
MNKKWVFILSICIILILFGGAMFNYFRKSEPKVSTELGAWISLPEPAHDGQTSIESALLKRQSVRQYAPDPLTLAEVSQLLWAAQGINRPGGYRTAPSAGALYPLELYLVSGQVDQLPSGVYRYHPENHNLEQLMLGDFRLELSRAALNQEFIQDAPAVILISAVYQRTTGKYGERGIQYVHMEVGSAAENIYLQAVSLNLGTVFVGAFHDDQVKELLRLDAQEQPLCLLPVGKIAQ